MGKSVKVGIVGCGNICGTYLSANERFDNIDFVAVSDIDMSRAEAKAEEYGFVRACTVDDLMADPEIGIVVNLTVPAAHYEVARRALEAGKSVHNEKPLALERPEGRELLALAERKGLLVGCAPDTFMGGAHQTCRELVDSGAIGEPVAATAFMMCRGPESWHPSPDFFYKRGGGPMFDMGPYYLTALVNMLGPVRRVTGSARASFPDRVIGSGERQGQKIEVETPTHLAGVLDFASGAVGTIVMSFDVWGGRVPCIEVYGTEGSLAVPDPNCFGGEVLLMKGGGEWKPVPLTRPYCEQSRGIALADMAYALAAGRPHRASGRLAFHVLDVMHAVGEASDSGRHVEIESTCERPEPLKSAEDAAKCLN
jgi:predicted dehydrogenase